MSTLEKMVAPKSKSELSNLTKEDREFIAHLQDGYFCYFSRLTKEAQEKIQKYVQYYLENEIDDNIVLNVFFTHGQSLEVFLTDDMAREDMKEMAEHIEDRLKVYFSLDFVCRSIGHNHMGFIVNEDQVED